MCTWLQSRELRQHARKRCHKKHANSAQPQAGSDLLIALAPGTVDAGAEPQSRDCRLWGRLVLCGPTSFLGQQEVCPDLTLLPSLGWEGAREEVWTHPVERQCRVSDRGNGPTVRWKRRIFPPMKPNQRGSPVGGSVEACFPGNGLKVQQTSLKQWEQHLGENYWPADGGTGCTLGCAKGRFGLQCPEMFC